MNTFFFIIIAFIGMAFLVLKRLGGTRKCLAVSGVCFIILFFLAPTGWINDSAVKISLLVAGIGLFLYGLTSPKK